MTVESGSTPTNAARDLEITGKINATELRMIALPAAALALATQDKPAITYAKVRPLKGRERLYAEISADIASRVVAKNKAENLELEGWMAEILGE